MAESGDGTDSETVPEGSAALLLLAGGDGDAEELVEVVDLESGPDDLANEIEDVDLEEEEVASWETEEEDEGVEEGMEAQDDSEVTFSKHTASVFCVRIDPKTNTLAVTGGEDDKAYVWCLSDGELLFECSGHKDSVTCAGFSHDSTFVATGDMSGLIKVWRVDTKEEIWSFEVGDLEWMEWHPQAHVLLAGTADGNSWMWKIPSGECKTFQGPNCPATCGHVLPDGQDGHQGPLTCVASNKDGSLVLTGSVDCHTKLVNSATGKVVFVFKGESIVPKPSAGETEEVEINSVESLGFCNIMPLAAVGYLDGTLDIYDLATQTLRHKCQHESGIVQLLWEENSPVVYTCSLDGAVYLWDARSGKLISEYRGHSAEILDFALNKDASIVVTTSGDHQAKVFCVQRPDR
uniref:Uncharacterized protein n=1 Tax=Sphaerodactylus townsendi TaxID=933632 RepID=A0ACB8G2A2_9SAUR